MEKSQPDFKMTVSKSNDEYVPSLKYDRLTSLYDLVQKWTFPELSSQSKLMNQSTIERVTDFGANPLRKRGILAPLKELFVPYQPSDYELIVSGGWDDLEGRSLPAGAQSAGITN